MSDQTAREQIVIMTRCDHFCHDADSGLNPWVRACPVCGCENPDFDPEAVSDIAPFDVLWETR
jgi:hypothetical protein